MALLYVGPRNLDLHTDYHISPIFTPAHLLAQFPPVYMSCGERDPFVDDVRRSIFFSFVRCLFVDSSLISLHLIRRSY
jgi:acetyl esterase/lipase